MPLEIQKCGGEKFTVTDIDVERKKLERFTGEAGRAKRMIMSQLPMLREAQMLTSRLIWMIKANPELMILLSAIQVGALTWAEVQGLAERREEQMKRTQDMLARVGQSPP